MIDFFGFLNAISSFLCFDVVQKVFIRSVFCLQKVHDGKFPVAQRASSYKYVGYGSIPYTCTGLLDYQKFRRQKFRRRKFRGQKFCRQKFRRQKFRCRKFRGQKFRRQKLRRRKFRGQKFCRRKFRRQKFRRSDYLIIVLIIIDHCTFITIIDYFLLWFLEKKLMTTFLIPQDTPCFFHQPPNTKLFRHLKQKLPQFFDSFIKKQKFTP